MPSATARTSRSMLPTPRMPKGLPEVDLTDNAYEVLTRRYIRKGENGELTETPEELFWRVAYHTNAPADLMVLPMDEACGGPKQKPCA